LVNNALSSSCLSVVCAAFSARIQLFYEIAPDYNLFFQFRGRFYDSFFFLQQGGIVASIKKRYLS